MNLEAGVRPAFPPSLVVQVKALACELPLRKGLPLSRFSIADIRQEVLAQGLVAEISEATIWRWLSQDAIRPWRYRSWIFPRDPLFLEKAAPILDLYQGVWQGQPLGPQDFVLCADEKPSIQARRRKHPSLPPAPPFQLASSTSMSARELGFTSPPGTSGAPKPSVVAHTGTGSNTLMV
jgi:hypothetical protein